MNLRYINRTDLIVAGACVLTLIVFLINTMLDSAILLYINNLIILGVFVYWVIRKDATGMLRRSLVIGGMGGFFYTFVDKLFVELRAITYITYIKRGTVIGGGIKDISIPTFATPVSIVLLWIFCIAIVIYFYQRLRSVFGSFYIPALLAGISAALGSIVLSNLADGLWVWNFVNPASPVWSSFSLGIGSTPLFVPLALFLTFLASPYIIGGQRLSRRLRISENPVVAGLRCGVILPAMVYISFRILTG
ncbi:hypothetical protein ACFL6S_04580 [Candidatus Poribacteria bacterium]